MTPAIAALLGGGVASAYVPILRDQLRDGELRIPLGSNVNPLRLNRDTAPVLFRIGAILTIVLTAALLLACIVILIEGVIR